jgi:hypothetical protein
LVSSWRCEKQSQVHPVTRSRRYEIRQICDDGLAFSGPDNDERFGIDLEQISRSHLGRDVV